MYSMLSRPPAISRIVRLEFTFEPLLKLGSQPILREGSRELPPLLETLVQFVALQQERSQAGDVSVETGLKGRDGESRKVPSLVERPRFRSWRSLRMRNGEHASRGEESAGEEEESGFLMQEVGGCRKKSMGSRDHCMEGVSKLGC